MFIVPAAPALGGYLQHYFGWRSVFVFMTGYTIFALLAILFGFKETSKHHHPDKLKLPYIISTFQTLFTSSIFMGITFCTFLSYGAFFAWFTAGPVLLIHNVGITPVTFGWLTFIGGGLAYALAGWINGRLVGRWGMSNMMRMGWVFMILAGLVMLFGKLLFGINVWVIIIPIIIFYFGSTFIWPNAFASAFTPFGHIAGYAGALYGFMQISGGAVISGLISYLRDTNQVPLALVFIVASGLSWVVYEMLQIKNKRLSPAHTNLHRLTKKVLIPSEKIIRDERDKR